jgi:arginase
VDGRHPGRALRRGVDVRILTVPWDAGHHERRMGRGPGALLRAGFADGLRAVAGSVDHHDVGIDPTYLGAADFLTEIATSFSLWHRLSHAVADARGEGRMPVVLTGNCGASLGVVGGLAAPGGVHRERIGVVWMDAHGDFNTPDTTASGFLDGMSMAALVGRCWRTLTQRTPGFAVPERNVLHLGARDVDGAEEAALAASQVQRVDAAGLRDAGRLDRALAELSDRVDALYLHLDLDVLDPGEAPANTFVLAATGGSGPSSPAGLTADELVAIVGRIAAAVPVAAVTLSAYDPGADPDGRVPPIALRVVQAALRTATG